MSHTVCMLSLESETLKRQQFSGSNLWEKCFWSAVCTYSCRPQLHGPSLSYVMLNCEGCAPFQHGILRRGQTKFCIHHDEGGNCCNLTPNHCWCRHRKGCCWILSTQKKLTDWLQKFNQSLIHMFTYVSFYIYIYFHFMSWQEHTRLWRHPTAQWVACAPDWACPLRMSARCTGWSRPTPPESASAPSPQSRRM